jgi:hypothetical protein
MTGVVGGRPKPAPVIRLAHLLVPREDVPVRVTVDGEITPLPPPAAGAPVPGTPPLPESPASPTAPGAVPTALRDLAWARSGDKGDDANIGLIARRPEYLPVLVEQVTAALVAETFGAWLRGDVRRWLVPGFDAMNILLTGVLGGRGGTSSLRYDPQGKTFGALLLDVVVLLPPDLAAVSRG